MCERGRGKCPQPFPFSWGALVRSEGQGLLAVDLPEELGSHLYRGERGTVCKARSCSTLGSRWGKLLSILQIRTLRPRGVM